MSKKYEIKILLSSRTRVIHCLRRTSLPPNYLHHHHHQPAKGPPKQWKRIEAFSSPYQFYTFSYIFSVLSAGSDERCDTDLPPTLNFLPAVMVARGNPNKTHTATGHHQLVLVVLVHSRSERKAVKPRPYQIDFSVFSRQSAAAPREGGTRSDSDLAKNSTRLAEKGRSVGADILGKVLNSLAMRWW